ncbi:MucBP domain-containing protein [Enterococcus sp. BWR-S5]|uniref:MucBP domain-containing protein n=1 Tax=Enterococcus sp. BWR-S5 TaxID=2787714 RepID=UPI00192078E8|nr:MucBP domain-containing protein [Enterococcus sp. BWR-S5]MBL1225415.1 MucBP domain-containing protein [Enterococcus sp. BWR-S5]
MKKKVYVALLSLCCPIMLNTQQVFAEEAAGEPTPTSETVGLEDQLPEGGPEELPAVSEPEVSEEAPEVTEETTDTTEETVVEETDVTEETVESTEAEESADTVEGAAEMSARAIMNFTVSFVDETTGVLIGSSTIAQEEGTTVVIALPTNGYFVVDTPVGSGFSVELDASNNPVLVGEVTSASADFTVTMRAFNASGDAQINFVDEAGNAVAGAPSVMLGGEVGDVVSYDPPVIPGYTYSGGTVSVTLTDTLQTVNVVYTRIETTLTVTYLDQAGNQLIADETYTGKFGEVYEFTPASFSGLELISMNGAPFTTADLPIVVSMGETDQHMVLV